MHKLFAFLGLFEQGISNVVSKVGVAIKQNERCHNFKHDDGPEAQFCIYNINK